MNNLWPDQLNISLLTQPIGRRVMGTLYAHRLIALSEQEHFAQLLYTLYNYLLRIIQFLVQFARHFINGHFIYGHFFNSCKHASEFLTQPSQTRDALIKRIVGQPQQQGVPPEVLIQKEERREAIITSAIFHTPLVGFKQKDDKSFTRTAKG